MSQFKKQKRTYYPRRNPKATTWYIDYFTAGNTFSQEGHRDHLFFRQRFRVPYAKYKEMVDECRTVGWWKERPDANGRPGAPIEERRWSCWLESLRKDVECT